MDRKEFYYRQKVLEEDLNEAYDDAENSIRDFGFDTDFVARTPTSAKSQFGGIVWGFDASDEGGTTLRIQKGVAYDELGRRIGTDNELTDYLDLSLTATGSTTIGEGGTPTGGSTIAPGEGNECWVTVFIEFQREDSAPAYDGYNDLVYFDSNESFQFHVEMGDYYAIGALPANPASGGAALNRQSEKVLLWDVQMRHAGGGSLEIYKIHGIEAPAWNPNEDAELDAQRTEWFFNYTDGATTKIRHKGNIRDAMDAILNYYDNHVNGVEDVHPASDIDFSATYTWANGSSGFYGAAVTVQDAIDGVVYDLASVSAPAGVARIGVAGATGTLTTPASTNPVTLLSGELKDAIDLLQIAVNGRVFRGGDDGITGTIAPNTDGVALGIASQRWDAYIQNLDVEIIACDLIPDGDDARVVGSGSARWQGEFTTINATDITAVTVEGSIIVPVADDLTCNGPLYCDGVAAFTNQTSVDESVDSDAALTVLNAGTTDAIGIDVTASGSSSSIGIKATSTDGTANYCSSSAGTASYCSSSTGVALAAVAAGTSPAIQASNTSSGNGIVGSSTSGVGVAGTSFGLTTNKYIVQKIPMSAGCSEIDGSGGAYWKQTADAWFLLGATPGYYVAFSIPWHPYGGELLKVITWAHPNTGTITLNATRKTISLSNISSSDVAFTEEIYPATSQSMLAAEPISGSTAGRIEHPVTVNNIVPRSEQTAVGGAYNSHDAYEVRLEYTADTTNAAIYGICLVWDMQSVSSFHGPILT